MNELIALNDQLMGLPAGALVIILVISLGYLLRGISLFNNKYIPMAVVATSTVLFMLLSPARDPQTLPRIWLTRNFIVGFILGFVAWGAHKLILQHIEDKVPGLKEWISKNDPDPVDPRPDAPKNSP